VINHCLIEKLAWSSLIALVATLILGIITAPISHDAVTNLYKFLHAFVPHGGWA